MEGLRSLEGHTAQVRALSLYLPCLNIGQAGQTKVRHLHGKRGVGGGGGGGEMMNVLCSLHGSMAFTLHQLAP